MAEESGEDVSTYQLICNIITKLLETSETCLELSSMDTTVDQIPEEVFLQFSNKDLLKVTELNMDFNDFLALPENIGLLKGLVKLSAEGNEVFSLPSNFTQLVLLQELRMNENKLREIPASFSQLRNMKVLSMVANKIRCIPEEAIQGLLLLEELYLDENELSILPENFGLLQSLKILELSENKLTCLPESFGGLIELQVLNLSRNNLSGLPSTFGDLSKLTNVDLSDNNISFLPEQFCSACVIEKFYLDNNIIGFLPDWFGNLLSIVYLSLNDNKLQNSPFPELFPSSSKATLKKLEAGGNAMSKLPHTFGLLENLEELHLGSTICELERRNFQNGNWLTKLPETFGNMKAISKLHLDENQLKSLPESFGNLASLVWLDLGQNLLSTLPDTFCDLEMLEYCQLSKNKLICLPESFGKLRKLTDLRLDQNLLEELPESCANLPALHTLDLFRNQLSVIPSWLSTLSCLKRLDLDENKLNLKLKDIPHLASQASHYAPRDPKLKDNWRGKTRPDKIPVEVEVIAGKENDNGEDDVDDGSVLSSYNENALHAAMRRGLSIWKSHSGPDERQVDRTEQNNFSEITFNVFDDDNCNDNSTTKNTGFYVKLGQKGNDNTEETIEDWDQEINTFQETLNNNADSSCFSIGVEVSQVELEKRNEFLSLLSSYPPASQAFSPTATYNSVLECNSSKKTQDMLYNVQQPIFIHGQFDDAD